MEILITSGGGSLEGTIRGEDGPAVAVPVTLVPEPPLPEMALRLKQAASNQYGRYSIQGVAPGRYRLFPRQVSRWTLLEGPESLKPYYDEAVEVEIGEGERKQVDVTLPRRSPATR
jgi:hypothetical protein